MDYEQRYKDALDRAKKLKENSDSTAVIDGCEQIFPELQGNEDEKMRQWIIDDIRYNMNNESLFHSEYKKKAEKAIAWLEQQGKTNVQNNNPFKIESDKFYFCIKDYFAGGCYRSKKGDIVLAKNGMNMMGLSPKEASEYFIPTNPFNEDVVDWFEKQREKSQEETVDNANKIKPKFDIGDWITCPAFISAPHLLHVIDNKDGLYELEDIYGVIKWLTIGHVESIYYHWTIEDAKDGDILACRNGWTCIFKCLNDNVFSSHCFMDSAGWFCENGGQAHTLEKSINIHPATKEQRDLLFQKMKESGHEWDTDKKELINTL